MNVKGMHYDIKLKLNKIDSQQYRNLKIPQLDWALNEAAELTVKRIAQPRLLNQFGFETSQRTIDDIRTIVVDDVAIVPTVVGTNYNIALPNNYWFYLSSKVDLTKGECTKSKVRTDFVQHDDEPMFFGVSSFEWEDINIKFFDQGIKVETDGSFAVTSFYIDYIRKMEFIHNAEDFGTGSYKNFEGVTLTGTQDCELPDHLHSEIVDLTVLILTGNLQIPDYQVKRDKLELLN